MNNEKMSKHIKITDIELVVIDVDGTMTDGGIYYDESGNEVKKFNTKDAAGFFALHQLEIPIMVLTGRKCMATKKRMEELKVKYLYQNIKKKYQFINEFANTNSIDFEKILYIGDDLNDYACMHKAGLRGCPADSCKEIINISHYVSKKKGGEGAVRDIIEHFLETEKQWLTLTSDIYGNGI